MALQFAFAKTTFARKPTRHTDTKGAPYCIDWLQPRSHNFHAKLHAPKLSATRMGCYRSRRGRKTKGTSSQAGPKTKSHGCCADKCSTHSHRTARPLHRASWLYGHLKCNPSPAAAPTAPGEDLCARAGRRARAVRPRGPAVQTSEGHRTSLEAQT